MFGLILDTVDRVCLGNRPLPQNTRLHMIQRAVMGSQPALLIKSLCCNLYLTIEVDRIDISASRFKLYIYITHSYFETRCQDFDITLNWCH